MQRDDSLGWGWLFCETAHFSCSARITHLTPSPLRLKACSCVSLKKGPNFNLGSVYRPPGQNLNTFNDEFNLILSVLCKKYKIIHLAGDFNIDLLKYQCHNLTNQFVNCIMQSALLLITF